MKTRILGLDPGLAILGFGVIDCQEKNHTSDLSPCEMIDFGVIQTSPEQPIGQRLSTIYDDLHTVIETFQPDLAVVEKFFFYRMANTITIAEARGVLMLVLAQNHLAFTEFTPAQIKQSLTGYGKAVKKEVQEAVARELNLDYIPKPDDAADALALALTGWFNR